LALPEQIDAAARAATKPCVPDVFDRILSTITDATAAQWATFTVDVITTARTRMPREDLLQVLDMLGITDSESAVRHGAAGKPVPLKGVCSVCNRRRDLQQDGTLRSHKRGGEYCPGRHKPPAAERRAVAS
jgi:hypothetical protein